jgi:molybdate transport system substrate-binding protein
MPAEIKILSAGAVKPGLAKVIDAFRNETGHQVTVSYATAPAIVKRIGGGETVDIVIAPAAVLEELVKSGKGAGVERVALGRIGVGVMVRDGALLPKIATVDEFKQSLLSADSVVYNQASTGIYLEALFVRLGIDAELKAKSTRYPDFAAVLDHVGRGQGREIGLGATTVIIENIGKGVKFAGPLPAEIQNYTAYAATLIVDGAAKDPAREFLHYLTSAAAITQLASAGIEER